MSGNIAITKARALFTREFLEHKTAFFTTPLVITLFMLGAFFLLTAGTATGIIEWHDDIWEIERNGMEHADEIARHVGMALYALSLPLQLVLPFVIFFVLLGSLYDDRKDRSILFWKSMPVSGLEEIGTKLLATIIMAPLILFGFIIILQIGFVILSMIFTSTVGLPNAGVLWQPGQMFSVWGLLIASFFLHALWALPIFGWLMLVSAYAPKAPLLYAVVPPVALFAVEGIFFHTAHLAEWFGGRLSSVAVQFNGDDIQLGGFGSLTQRDLFETDFLDAFTMTFTSGDFWFGTLLAAAFFAGALYLRKSHA